MSVGFRRILIGGTEAVDFDEDDVVDMLKVGVWKEYCPECESS